MRASPLYYNTEKLVSTNTSVVYCASNVRTKTDILNLILLLGILGHSSKKRCELLFH